LDKIPIIPADISVYCPIFKTVTTVQKKSSPKIKASNSNPQASRSAQKAIKNPSLVKRTFMSTATAGKIATVIQLIEQHGGSNATKLIQKYG